MKSVLNRDYKIEKQLQIAMKSLMSIDLHNTDTTPTQEKALAKAETAMNGLHAAFGIRSNILWWQRPISKKLMNAYMTAKAEK